MFHTLKYGCRNTAYLSASTVCSKLQFRGPTVADLQKAYQAEAKRVVEEHNSKHSTDLWDVDYYERGYKKSFDKLLQGAESVLTPTDIEKCSHFLNFQGMSLLREEPLLQEIVQNMQRTSRGVS
jgi:hypothetical protein